MNTYRVTDRTGYSGSWVLFAVLFILAILAWVYISPLGTLGIAAIGFIATGFNWWQGKKIVGDQIELTAEGIIFVHGSDSNCIAYNEIKSIKEARTWFSEPFYQIKTARSTVKLQPENYENGDVMRQKLQEAFAQFNCPVEK